MQASRLCTTDTPAPWFPHSQFQRQGGDLKPTLTQYLPFYMPLADTHHFRLPAALLLVPFFSASCIFLMGKSDFIHFCFSVLLGNSMFKGSSLFRDPV